MPHKLLWRCDLTKSISRGLTCLQWAIFLLKSAKYIMLLIRYLLILKDLRVPVVFWIDVVFYSFFYSIYTMYIFLIFKQNLVTVLNLTAHSFAPKVHVISDCNFKWAFSSSVWKSKGHRIFFKMLKFSKKSMPNCAYIPIKKILNNCSYYQMPKKSANTSKNHLGFLCSLNGNHSTYCYRLQ